MRSDSALGSEASLCVTYSFQMQKKKTTFKAQKRLIGENRRMPRPTEESKKMKKVVHRFT